MILDTFYRIIYPLNCTLSIFNFIIGEMCDFLQGRIQDFLYVSQNFCCHTTRGYSFFWGGREVGVICD